MQTTATKNAAERPTKAGPSEEPKKPLSVGSMHSDFVENELASNKKWLDKTLQMHGRLLRVSKSTDGKSYYAAFSVAESLHGDLFEGCVAILDKSAHDYFAKFKRSDLVEFVGACKGVARNAASYKGYVLNFVDCKAPAKK
jgi:hypothetical protein